MAYAIFDTASAARRGPAGLVVFAVVTALLAPRASYAQSSPGSEKGIYVGGSLGVYCESSEGMRGHAFAGSGIIGYRFNARWLVHLPTSA